MEELRSWWDRFRMWIRYEPVRAAETIRAMLFAVTGALAVGPGAEELITQIMAIITAAFSIYASQRTRNKVQPMAKIEDSVKREDAEEVFGDV